MVRWRTKRWVIATALVLVAGCGFGTRGAWAQPALPIRIGYQASPDWLLFTAMDRKFFEKAGLAPAFVKFDSARPMITAAHSNEIDVADVGILPFVVGLAQGVDWVMIGVSKEGAYIEGLAARRDSGIQTMADLRGRRVGYSQATTAHYGLVMALRQQGLRRDDVTLVDMTPADQLAGLASGAIDAAFVWDPWLQRMVFEASARIVTTEGDSGIYTNVDGFAVRRDWLRDNRDSAVRFLRAILMANDALRKDPTLGIGILAREMGIKETWAKAIYQNAPPPDVHGWTDRGYGYSLVEGAGFHRRLGYLATFLYDQKVISTPVDVSEVLDPSVIAEVLRTPAAEK